jgi:FkbM family methyltransferase
MYKEGETMRLQEVKDIGIEPNAVLDIGAHSGQFYGWSKSVWPLCPVYMIEANLEHEITLKNITFGMDDDYLMAALGDEEKEVTFYTRSDKPHTEGNSYYKEAMYWDIPHLVQKSKVKLQKLDNIFEDDAVFDLIKLDTQGSELDILKGGKELVDRAKAIILEVSFVEYNEGAPTSEELISYMDNIGFEKKICIGEHISNEPQWKDIIVQKDLVFLKK